MPLIILALRHGTGETEQRSSLHGEVGEPAKIGLPSDDRVRDVRGPGICLPTEIATKTTRERGGAYCPVGSTCMNGNWKPLKCSHRGYFENEQGGPFCWSHPVRFSEPRDDEVTVAY